MSRLTNFPKHLGHTHGTAKDLLELMPLIGATNYYELSLALGKNRDQLARAVKHLRAEGYLFRTTPKGGRYAADLELIGRQ